MPGYEIEIKKVGIRVYHYGFASLAISTVLRFPPDSEIPGKYSESNEKTDTQNNLQEDKLRHEYTSLRNFIEDCAGVDASNVDHGCPVIAEFRDLVSIIQRALNAKRNPIIGQFTKDHSNLIKGFEKKSIMKKTGFLWVHRLFYLPNKPDSGYSRKMQVNVAKKVFGRYTIGTKIKDLSSQECNQAYVAPGNSFAIVKNSMIPLNDGHSTTSDDDSNYIDDNLTTNSFSRILQTAGVLDAATMYLAFILDIVMDTYDRNDTVAYEKQRDKAIEDSVQQISHIRTMIYQYEQSLPPVGHKFFIAIKKEWKLDKRLDYINWKFETLKELHDRKSSKNLERTTLSFSIIASIGVLFALFSIAQNGDKLPRFTLDLWGSLVIMFILPIIALSFVLFCYYIGFTWKYLVFQIKQISGILKAHSHHAKLQTGTIHKSILQISTSKFLRWGLFLYILMITIFFLIVIIGDLIFGFDNIDEVKKWILTIFH